GLRSLRNRAPESGCIGSIELSHNLLTVRPWVSSHPVTLVKVEQPVNVWNSVQAPRENSPLLCDYSPATRMGISFGGAGMDSELVASSDKAAWSFSPDLVEDLALDPVAWANSDREE
ncbi:hypothetical protein H5410_045445, partial [Solanum commersonii]